MRPKLTHILILSLTILGTVIFLAGCGIAAIPNDAVPQGTVLAQGTLSGVNGQTVSGAAIIYQTSEGHILRLQGLTAPQVANLQAFVVVNGNEVGPVSLVSNTGNKNYTLNTSGIASPVFSQALIRPAGSITNYGQALLQAPTI